ncbi:MAG: AAA family ATPase [Gammaproteobacteria bacterium]|nr:AAA family ATPase [Gammaproteobacteria bacterium]
MLADMRTSSHDSDHGRLRAIVAALAAGLPEAEIRETHISLVLLAGDTAYKFKKAVDFGFLDFGTLEKRAHFCAEEVRLNRRFAPGIYRDVVAVRGTPEAPAIDGEGEVLEYAVRMRRFADGERLDALLAAGAVGRDDFVALGATLAALHEAAPRAAADSAFGTPPVVAAQILASFEHLDAPALRADVAARLAAAAPAFGARRAAGRIRECHGDLHLSNIVRDGDTLRPFDCIEFNPGLSVIDTMSDTAFLVMDLDERGRADLANACLNAYLEAGGDHAGLAMLRLYSAYRSVVRAKIAALSLASATDGAARADCGRRRDEHLALAARYLHVSEQPALVITHGVSGSGKTWAARRLAERHGHIHLRADVERRRLAALRATEASGSTLGGGLYSAGRTEAVYEHLLVLAGEILAAGYSVIVDAGFLAARHRAKFTALTAARGVTCRILDCDAPTEVLRQRIETRLAAGNDASEATLEVLEHQLATRDAFSTAERAIAIDAERALREGIPGCGRLATRS